jgi:succinate dehydrogenase / fumarate reductase, cytochrome b subunit
MSLAPADFRHFLLRRLHSLTGIIPIGAFLLIHFYTNYQAVGPGGAERFNEEVRHLQENPLIIWAELFGIGAPILFHAFYGLFLAGEGRWNVGRYGYRANWRYVFQRISGVLLLFFIGYHVWMTRLRTVFYPEMFTTNGGHVSFDYMHGYLTEAHLGLPTWILYVVGVTAATLHLANGLWGFLIHWGLTTGPRAQKISAYACAGLGIGLTLFGLNALAAFIIVP